MPAVTCGIDWAERHHDVALVDRAGALVARARIDAGPEGLAHLLGMLAGAGDTGTDPIPVAIETPRGLLVAALHAAGRPVYAINPLAVARYRQRHTVAGRKSDHGDAMTLAHILRTDAHLHRLLPDDSELARCVAVLARAHQDATWRRVRAVAELRSLLVIYYPGFLAAFGPKMSDLHHPEARAMLAVATTPRQAAALTHTLIEKTLRKAGRSRNIDERVAAIRHAFTQPQLRHPQPLEDVMGEHADTLLQTLDAESENVDYLGNRLQRLFRRHPDYLIITSFPGLADVTGARVLAEIGDDPAKFASSRALKAFAGSAPVTRASGRNVSVGFRVVKNRRLAAAGSLWAAVAAFTHGPAKEHYQRRRAGGDSHNAAVRNLLNKLLGQLYHCLRTRQTYQPDLAFARAREAAEGRPRREPT